MARSVQLLRLSRFNLKRSEEPASRGLARRGLALHYAPQTFDGSFNRKRVPGSQAHMTLTDGGRLYVSEMTPFALRAARSHRRPMADAAEVRNLARAVALSVLNNTASSNQARALLDALEESDEGAATT